MSSVALNTKNHSSDLKFNSDHETKSYENYFSYFIELPTEIQYNIFKFIGGIGTQVSILNTLTDLQNVVIRRKVMKAYYFFSSKSEDGSPAKIAFMTAVKQINADENVPLISYKTITNLALENLLNMLSYSEKIEIEEKFGLYSLGVEKIRETQQILLDNSLFLIWNKVKVKIRNLPRLPRHPPWLPNPNLPTDNNTRTIRKWIKENKNTLQRIDHLFTRDLKIIPPEFSCLTGLNSLTIYSKDLLDISILKKLTNLVKLNILQTQISDISPIENLTNLQELELQNNQISNIAPIENLTNLQCLKLGNNQISNIDPIKKLVNLKELFIWTNQIKDISAFSNLKNLRILNASNNQISDITSLELLVELEVLHLGNNEINNISSLRSLVNLKSLIIIKNKIQDFSFLKRLENLEYLGYWGNPITKH